MPDRALRVAVDARVLAFAVVLTLLTALTFGLVPMMRTGTAANLQDLREGPRATGGASAPSCCRSC